MVKRFDERIIKGNKVLMVSGITLRELSLAPEQVQEIYKKIPGEYIEYIEITNEVELLAKKYVSEKAVSSKFLGDAYHIAAATIHRVDVLVSWNFKHIVNINRIRLYNSVNLKYGYNLIEIRTPMEVLDEK